MFICIVNTVSGELTENFAIFENYSDYLNKIKIFKTEMENNRIEVGNPHIGKIECNKPIKINGWKLLLDNKLRLLFIDCREEYMPYLQLYFGEFRNSEEQEYIKVKIKKIYEVIE